MYDPAMKMLADQFEGDWVPFLLEQIGLPPSTPTAPVDSNLPAVALEADRAYRAGTDSPFLLHFEFESSRPSRRLGIPGQGGR